MTRTMLKVEKEIAGALAKYGDFNSPHEAFGVLLEEVLELQQEIKGHCWAKARKEAIQIAAVAIRLAAYETRLEKEGVL